MDSEVDFSYMYETFSNLIDKDQKCVFYLSSTMTVIGMSNRAKSMIASAGCLKIVKRKLVSANSSDLKTNFRITVEQSKPTVLFVRNAVDGEPCRINIEPTSRKTRGVGQYKNIAAMVIVACGGQTKELLTEELQDFFDLTRAEIDLVSALHQKITLSDYAALKGIKVSTARWTLANVFSKTQSNSQSNLRSLADIFTK